MKKISFLKRHAFALVLSLVSFVVYASPPIGPGNALAFDGSTTFVYAAIPNYLTANGNSFTSEVWINPATLTTADAQTIFGYGYDDGSTGNGLQLVIGGTSGASGQIAGHLMILYSGVSNYLDCGYTFPVTNIWYHVAITRYQGVTSFFVNGVQTSNTYSNSLNTPSEFRLGSQHGIRFFKGEMDEFRFYNYPLGAGSIQQDMLSLSANSSGLSSNLVAYYHFNVGVGGANNAGLTNCPDAQNNWPGTLNNFALNGNTSNWVESYAMVIPTATAANNITSTGFTANWTAPALGTVDNYF